MEANPETGATTVDGATSRISALLSPEPTAPTESENVETVETATTEETPQGDTQSEEARYTVKVDGEEREVSLEDMRKGYMMESDYRKKTSEVSERKQALERKESEIDDQLAQAQSLLSVEIDAMDSPEMIELKEYDPEAYLKEVDKLEAKSKRLNSLKEKRDAELAEKGQETVKRELESLERAIPDWIDPTVRATEGQAALKLLETIGFNGDELNGITDHRMLVLARMAMKYQDISAQDLESKRVNNPPKSQQPGTANDRSSSEDRLKSLRSKAKNTGNMRDSAKFIRALMES